MLAVHAAGLPAPREDGAAAVLALYRSARASLPGTGPVAFVPTATDSTDAAAMRALAQFALVPMVLVDDPAAAPVAITGPAASDRVDAAMAAAGLALVTVSPGGVRVYRR